VCRVVSSTQMECPSPAVDIAAVVLKVKAQTEASKGSSWRRGRSLEKWVEGQATLHIGFIMDSVQTVRDLEKHFQSLRAQLLYVEDPKFFQFPRLSKSYKGDTLVIEVSILWIVCEYKQTAIS